MNNIQNQFPFFIHNPQAVYLDSAATTQKPISVLEAVETFYRTENANAGRGNYLFSTSLAKKIQDVREQTARFLNAEKSEISFTGGATDSQNRLACSLSTVLKDGDQILYSPYDHASFVEPWLLLQKQLQYFGITITLVPYQVKNTGGADIEDIFSKINSKTKLINITHVHNIFGSDSDIYELKPLREKGILINVDAAQSVGHIPVDVEYLGADFVSFSGHKMFAPYGVGVLYARKEKQRLLNTSFVGGGMKAGQGFFEAGTLDYAAIIGLGKAIEYVESIGLENIHQHLVEITQYALSKLKKIAGIEFVNGPYYWRCADGFGIISFRLENIDPVDVAFYLSQQGIMVRAGDHCNITSNAITNTVRISMHIYNSLEDIDRLVAAIQGLVEQGR